ncbi:MAG: hypothetical protein ABFR53_10590 [Actinomycetota bacterium]
MSKRRIVGLVALALAVSACIGPSLDELVQAADALAIPTDWEHLEEETADRPCLDPVEDCPNVALTYRVPGETSFGAATTQVFESGGFTVWKPASARCTPSPEKGCGVSARLDGVSAQAIVVDVEPASYIVTLRFSEYVGP